MLFQESTTKPVDSQGGVRMLGDRSRAQNNPTLPKEKEEKPLR